MILIDTHIWLWFLRSHKRLKPEQSQKIEQALAGGGVLLSAISVWEMAMLAEKGRIDLKLRTELWIKKALSIPGLTLAPLSPEILIESTQLPGCFHSDPADQMIAATSRVMNVPLLTADKQILEYAKEGYLKLA